MTSPDFTQANIDKIAELFPNVMTESLDADGNPERAVDFDLLRQELSGHIIEGPQERYRLDWPGKRAAAFAANAPIAKTLRPVREESVNFDTTKNLFIEGDNLDALKLLQESYLGKVKLIYIDPPYNTGNDSFIYPDKFSESREEYARRVGDTDDAGYLKRDGVFQGAWRKNGKDSGHYHSNWLSMMLPRLHLAKTLLREDGVIFISIDDNEQAQLKLLCDEVFGAENFLANLIWQKKYAATNDAKGFSTLHDYIIVYQKGSEFERNLLPRTEAQNKPYKNDDGDGKGLWRSDNLLVKSFSASAVYPIRNPNTGEEFFPPQGSSWRASQSTMEIWLKENRIFFGKDGLGAPQLKRYLNEVQQGRVPTTWWNFEEVGHNDGANKELQSLFNSKAPFDTPKPTTLLLQMLKIGSNPNDLILDFFSGSGTTAHAVMQLNAEDGGSRRFICVQLPEETDEKSEARKAGFNTIAEIAKERIRRAGRQISDGLQDGSETDTGFKVFKLAESGFKQWRQPEQADTEALQRELSLNIDSVLSETSSENLLYELMLRMGLKLTCKVSFSDDVYFVEDEDTGGLYAFLLERVDQGLIDAVLEKHPVKVVVLDRLFNDDALKSNTVLQMKDAGVMFECV